MYSICIHYPYMYIEYAQKVRVPLVDEKGKPKKDDPEFDPTAMPVCKHGEEEGEETMKVWSKLNVNPLFNWADKALSWKIQAIFKEVLCNIMPYHTYKTSLWLIRSLHVLHQVYQMSQDLIRCH